MKSLKEVALEQIRKRFLGKVETLQLLDLANELDMKDFREECLSAIRFSYDFFRDVADQSYLRQVCGEEEVIKLEQAYREKHRSRRYLRQEGKVLEKVDTPFSNAVIPLLVEENDEGTNLPTCFPYDALKAGVKWPKNVDPTRREDWLSDDDFKMLFKMSRMEFKSLNKFKRERLKKELLLW
jgi:hypothetical protein